MPQKAELESQNYFGWKRSLRSLSPTVNSVLASLNPVPKCCIHTFSEHLQGGRFHHHRLPYGIAGMWKRMSRQCRQLLSPRKCYCNSWNHLLPPPSFLTTGILSHAQNLSGLVSTSVIQKRTASAERVADTLHHCLR